MAVILDCALLLAVTFYAIVQQYCLEQTRETLLANGVAAISPTTDLVFGFPYMAGLPIFGVALLTCANLFGKCLDQSKWGSAICAAAAVLAIVASAQLLGHGSAFWIIR